MKELIITGNTGSSRVLEGILLQDIAALLPRKKLIIITDENLARLYAGRFPEAPVIILPPGEQSKELGRLETIYMKLLDFGADRSTFLLGIGGGVVCDITGFVASTFMRGISFGFVPSSLLAQVDASLGGKNGVNLGKMKNMVGVIRQPELILCDPALLSTLSEKEFLSGLAEVVKHALIRDPDYFDWLKKKWNPIRKMEPDSLEKMIWWSIRIKREVVEQDEKEEGLRRILNFGHTFGHAIEKVHSLKHGEAVSYGMLIAVYISVMEGLLQEAVASEISSFIHTSGLMEEHRLDGLEISRIFRADKKRSGNQIHFVLLSAIGQAVTRRLEQDKLEKYFLEWLGNFNLVSAKVK